MKKINKMNVLMIVILATITLFSTSCKKEKSSYQVKVRNACEKQLLGQPFMKYNIKKLTLGDNTFTDVANGKDSQYLGVESGTEYPMSITYDSYLYNTDKGIYEFDRTQTKDFGSETWTTKEESDKFIIKVKIGDILQGYNPIYEVFFVK